MSRVAWEVITVGYSDTPWAVSLAMQHFIVSQLQYCPFFLDPDACIWFIGRRTVKSVEPLILRRSIPKVRFVFYEYLLFLEISSYLLVNL